MKRLDKKYVSRFVHLAICAFVLCMPMLVVEPNRQSPSSSEYARMVLLPATFIFLFYLNYSVLIEKFLEHKQDVNCAACCIRGEICVSEAEEAFGDGIYSFEEKYVKRTADGTKGGGRCVLNGDLRDKIRAYTKTLYKRLNLSGVVRMDFLVSDKKAYLCEVNTVPGSLAYYLFCERITDARTFFSDLIEEALRSTNDKKVLSTGILRKVKWLGK